MVRIEYKILEREKQRLIGLQDVREYEDDVSNVLGLIKMKFNEKEIGSVRWEESYYGDYLIEWFLNLNGVIVGLKTHNFVTMLIPDSAYMWLEFRPEGRILHVTKIQAEHIIRVEPGVMYTPKRRNKCCWIEDIDREQFVNEVLTRTGRFMLEATTLNEILVRTREIRRLEELFRESKEIYSRS